jgi:hypothetical protein
MVFCVESCRRYGNQPKARTTPSSSTASNTSDLTGYVLLHVVQQQQQHPSLLFFLRSGVVSCLSTQLVPRPLFSGYVYSVISLHGSLFL